MDAKKMVEMCENTCPLRLLFVMDGISKHTYFFLSVVFFSKKKKNIYIYQISCMLQSDVFSLTKKQTQLGFTSGRFLDQALLVHPLKHLSVVVNLEDELSQDVRAAEAVLRTY